MKRSLQTILTAIFAVLFLADFLSAQEHFNTNKISMEQAAYGRIRVYAPAYDSLQQINRLSLIVGTDNTHVFNYKEEANDVDTAQVVSNPQLSDYELYCSIDNSYTDLPPDILAKISIYGWNDEAFSIVKFNIKNQDKESSDYNAYIGCEIIPKVDNDWGYESLKLIPDKDIIAIYKTPSSTWTGFKILSAPLYSAKFIDWFDGYDVGSAGDSLNWSIMSSGVKQQTTIETGADGSVGFFSADLAQIKFNSVKDFYVATAVGATEEEMVANMDKAVAKYNSVFGTTKTIAMELADYGRIRVYSPVMDSLQQINRLSLLVGTDNTHVFNYKEDANEVDTAQVVANPQFSDEELYGSIDNSYTNLPPDVLCKINVYSWNEVGYSIIKFNIKNQDTGSNDYNAYLGCEIIPKVDNDWGYESLKLIPDKDIIAVYKTPSSTWTGFKILSAPLYTAKFIDWFDGYDVGTAGDSLNWSIMSSGTKQQTVLETGADGSVGFFSTDLTQIKYNSTKDFYVAAAVGSDEAEMVNNMEKAVAKYSGTFTSVEKENNILPKEFSLKQNYPNPFNPATNISFSLPSRENVVLKIYNSLGQEISTLINTDLSAGNYTFNFNAANLSSGIYFYSLTAGNFLSSKKMMLIK
jgi:hypothetical protein